MISNYSKQLFHALIVGVFIYLSLYCVYFILTLKRKCSQLTNVNVHS